MFILQNTDKTHFLIFKIFGQCNKVNVYNNKNNMVLDIVCIREVII